MVPLDDKKALTRNHSLIQGEKKGEMEPTKSFPASRKKGVLKIHLENFQLCRRGQNLVMWPSLDVWKTGKSSHLLPSKLSNQGKVGDEFCF